MYCGHMLINRAAMGQAQFMFYPWFIIFFFCQRSDADLHSANFELCNL